jgi:hypothetical protein
LLRERAKKGTHCLISLKASSDTAGQSRLKEGRAHELLLTAADKGPTPKVRKMVLDDAALALDHALEAERPLLAVGRVREELAQPGNRCQLEALASLTADDRRPVQDDGRGAGVARQQELVRIRRMGPADTGDGGEGHGGGEGRACTDLVVREGGMGCPG